MKTKNCLPVDAISIVVENLILLGLLDFVNEFLWAAIGIVVVEILRWILRKKFENNIKATYIGIGITIIFTVLVVALCSWQGWMAKDRVVIYGMCSLLLVVSELISTYRGQENKEANEL